MSADREQITVLNYGRAERDLRQWLQRLPRPSKWTVLLLILAIPAVLWLLADHQPWVVERTFPQINSNGRLLTYEDEYLLVGTKRALDLDMLIGPFEIYDISTGDRISHFGESVWANDAVFAPDGRRLVTHGGTYKSLKQIGDRYSLGEYSGMPWRISLWDTQNGALIAELDPVKPAWSEGLIRSRQIYFSPDSQRLIILSHTRVMLYDARTGAAIAELELPDVHHEERQIVGGHAWFSPDNRFVVVQMWDPNPVRIWSATDGDPISEFILPNSDGAQINAAFSPDSTTLAVADDGWLYLVDPATATLRHPPVELGAAHGVWFAPDTHTVVIWHDAPTGKMLTAVDTSSGAITASMPQTGNAITSHYHWLPVLRWSPDGRQVVLLTMEAGAQVRDATALQPIVRLSNHLPTRSFAFFSPDGLRAITAYPYVVGLELRAIDDWRVTSIIPGNDPWPILDAKFINGATRVLTARQNGVVELWRLRRPEAAWGVIALPQFWIAAVLALGFFLSAGRDIRRWAR